VHWADASHGAPGPRPVEGRVDTGGDDRSFADAGDLSMAGGWCADRHGAGVGSTSETANPDQGSAEHRSAGYCPAIGAGFVNDGPPAHESSSAPYDPHVLPTSWSILLRVTVLQLTQAKIDEGIVRAEKVRCSPLDDCCFPLCWTPRESHEMCKPKGDCQIGWIVARRAGDQSPAGLTGGRIEVRRITRVHLQPGDGTAILSRSS
jgi:hypothetical protein